MTQTLLLAIALFSAVMLAVSFYFISKVIKFTVLALFVFLANAIYFSFDGVKGWPSEEPTEVKGILASVVIVNPTDEDAGGIYIGLYPSTPIKWYQYTYPRYAPKTFYIKYSNDRASEFEKAKQALEEGKEVRINGIPPENSPASEGGEPTDGNLVDQISNMIANVTSKLLKPKDTYKPDVPDVEIVSPELPPQKGSSQ